MTLIELLTLEVNALEISLQGKERHDCRFCNWFNCGPECKCGCGQVSRAKQAHIERLKYLIECVETGEVPNESTT